MTDAQQALAQVREALAQKINNPMDGHETYTAMQEFWRVCTPANIDAILAHVEAQKAEIERLRGLLCKCNMRTRLVGDGCEFCNPQFADELAKEQQ